MCPQKIESYKKLGYMLTGEIEAKLEIYENSSGQWQKAKDYSYSYDLVGDSYLPQKKENITSQTDFKEAIQCLIPENTTKIMLVITPDDTFFKKKYYIIDFYRSKLSKEGNIKLFFLLDYGTYLKKMNIMLPEWNSLSDFRDIILEKNEK